MPADRDFGPVLASQLGNSVNNALTFRLRSQVTVNYDRHRMRLGGAWQGGFLDLSETHHFRQRGDVVDGVGVERERLELRHLGQRRDVAQRGVAELQAKLAESEDSRFLMRPVRWSPRSTLKLLATARLVTTSCS